MSTAALAAVADAAPRKIPEVAPSAVTIDAHQGYRRATIKPLPENFILDDWKEPALWRHVQSSGRVALRQDDEIFAIAYDGSFALHAFCIAADGRGAECSKPTSIPRKSRATESYENADYYTMWHGDGYEVYRKRDNGRVGLERFATIALAKAFIESQYPKRIG